MFNPCDCVKTYKVPSRSRPGTYHMVHYDQGTKTASCDCLGYEAHGRCWHKRRVLAFEGVRKEFDGTQEEATLAYMKHYGSIDCDEAMTFLGIVQLPPRIMRLRRELHGTHYIDTDYKTVKGRFGFERSIGNYTLHKVKEKWEGNF